MDAVEFCISNNIPILDVQNYLPSDINESNNCIFDDDMDDIDFINGVINSNIGKLIINPPVYIKRNDKLVSGNCSAYFTTLRVDGFGSVEGCCKMMIPKPGNGNIFSDEDVWKNPFFISKRNDYKYTGLSPISKGK
ncbi:hypothetical protein [Methanoplanus limicola]|uniref:Uncharacterized protein n=1 Tax=Methanoplanus limicola DSM 2279 TaxID=937775 RepID=H1Z4E4_9EURY|nr:hypothetical protein [Methanoplanus limicola]EHQ36692.1 hypothetical protein Metlim_2652 [Methanoplanus limicola DSM 2279]